jgi:hypothetical protein
MRARISVAADQRKARERFDYCVGRAQTALSQVLSATKPRDGQGLERQSVAQRADAQVDGQQHIWRPWLLFLFSRALAGGGLDHASNHGKHESCLMWLDTISAIRSLPQNIASSRYN